jgi:hypothetical protein
MRMMVITDILHSLLMRDAAFFRKQNGKNPQSEKAINGVVSHRRRKKWGVGYGEKWILTKIACLNAEFLQVFCSSFTEKDRLRNKALERVSIYL